MIDCFYDAQKTDSAAKKPAVVNKTIKKNAKNAKKKKLNLKFAIDCSHPVEDGILDMTSFVS